MKYMNIQPQVLQKPEEKKSDGFQNFSEKMTTSIAFASGGAAIGTFFGGPVGATVGALVSGVAGFVVSGSHNDSKTHN
jgi:hypothetical protein